MRAKVFRIFCGEYMPDPEKLQAKKYTNMRLRLAPFLALSADQGFGKVVGTTRKLGESIGRVDVVLYKRETADKIWRVKSDKNGNYKFKNVAKSAECFVVALDPNREYNAVISDGVVAE